MLTYIVMTTAVKLLRISSRLFVSSLLVLPFVGVISFISPSTAHANPAVVINELMYNPASDNQDEEYLELYNTSGAPIDVSDWCFTAGISGCFTSGTTIAANGYLVVSPSSSQTQTTYSLTPDLVYSGNLSNGGETITLTDNNAVQVDTLTYDDASPWPTTPDGNGPSLELKNPDADNSQAAAWAASLSSGGTPNTQNSVYGIELPEITDVSRHTFVASSTAVTVTAEIEDSTDVDLVYKIMFDAEVTIPMHDDGNHNDGDPGDGIYGAQIPGQTAGTLVRYKIQATNPDGTASSPGTDDTLNYYPYIVDDGQTAGIPIVRWYMDPADYDDMNDNHAIDKQQFPAVIAVGDQIIDNALVRIKGQSSVSFPKRKYKFDLPKGYTIQPSGFDFPVDEFAIQVYFLNMSDLQEGLAWEAFQSAGFKKLQNQYVRAQRNNPTSNSQFIGHYLLIENYDKSWRERNNYQSGALYKQAYDKKTRLDEDNSDIADFANKLQTLEGQELKDYLLDNINIPAMINYHATSAATFSSDWSFIKNIYQYKDTEGTGRWEYLPWDLDNVFLPSLYEGMSSVEFLKQPIAALADPTKGADSGYYEGAIVERAMYQFPEFRDMFFRRSISLYDQIWQNGTYKQWHDELYDKSNQTMTDDFALWNPYRQATLESAFPDGFPYRFVDDFPLDVDENNIFGSAALQSPEMMRTLFFFAASRFNTEVAQARTNHELLPTQTKQQEAKIKITEIYPTPTEGNEYQFIELYNGADVPVDMSKWTLSGADFTMPAGSVLPAKSYGLVVKNDKLFRSKNPSVLIFGQYSGRLSDSGESITLKNGNNVISSVDYGIKSPWPSVNKYPGRSLSLINVSADESNPACWAPSYSKDGTPQTKNKIAVAYDNTNCYKVDPANPPKSGLSTIGSLINYLFHHTVTTNTSQLTEKNDKQTADNIDEQDPVGYIDNDTPNNLAISSNHSASSTIPTAPRIAIITTSLATLSFICYKAYAIINKRRMK